MKKDIIERIIDKLDEYKDCEIYGCDLSYTLFEGENVDGTFTYNTYEAKQWIKSYYDDIGEVWEELQFNFDKEYLMQFNMFDNPEKFMVLIILESASYLISRCKLISDNWDNTIILDENNIKILTEQLKELDDGGSIYK